MAEQEQTTYYLTPDNTKGIVLSTDGVITKRWYSASGLAEIKHGMIRHGVRTREPIGLDRIMRRGGEQIKVCGIPFYWINTNNFTGLKIRGLEEEKLNILNGTIEDFGDYMVYQGGVQVAQMFFNVTRVRPELNIRASIAITSGREVWSRREYISMKGGGSYEHSLMQGKIADVAFCGINSLVINIE